MNFKLGLRVMAVVALVLASTAVIVQPDALASTDMAAAVANPILALSCSL